MIQNPTRKNLNKTVKKKIKVFFFFNLLNSNKIFLPTWQKVKKQNQ